VLIIVFTMGTAHGLHESVGCLTTPGLPEPSPCGLGPVAGLPREGHPFLTHWATSLFNSALYTDVYVLWVL